MLVMCSTASGIAALVHLLRPSHQGGAFLGAVAGAPQPCMLAERRPGGLMTGPHCSGACIAALGSAAASAFLPVFSTRT